jgi:hypothetical protein
VQRLRVADAQRNNCSARLVRMDRRSMTDRKEELLQAMRQLVEESRRLKDRHDQILREHARLKQELDRLNEADAGHA